MTVAVVDGWDATHENLPQAPTTGQAGGYLTGTPNIRWTDADIASHPGVVLYDQSPVITDFDTTADLLDVEAGAAGDEDIVPFIEEARIHFLNGTRPGQRWPGVYCSRNRVTEVVNIMVAARLEGVPLAVADYTFDRNGAIQEVANPSGPYPIVVRQYSDRGGGGLFDLDVYSVPWLQHRSIRMPPMAQVPPGQWNPASGWTWATNVIPPMLLGMGLNGELYVWILNSVTGQWVKHQLPTP